MEKIIQEKNLNIGLKTWDSLLYQEVLLEKKNPLQLSLMLTRKVQEHTR